MNNQFVQTIDKAVGIDLGTTNSAVGLLNPSDNDIILYRDEAGRETTPSCVWRDPVTGEIVVGHQAFCRRGTTPAPMRSFKRLMGRAVKQDLGGGCQKSPEELSSHVLEEMKRQIKTVTDALSVDGVQWVVRRAIVTVPAYFSQPEVTATMEAARLARLELVELLHEPTAAAIYHCWRTKSRDGLFMVYDLGGGTFDVTILKITAGEPKVLGLSGNTQLGGDDLDRAIAEGILQQLQNDKQANYALNLDPADPEDNLRMELLKYLAEGVKKKLSDETEYVLRDHSTLRDKRGRPVIFNTVFERHQVVGWMMPVIERTIPYCHTALKQAAELGDIRLADIQELVLAGGSTHIPTVRDRVRKEFCQLKPDEFKTFNDSRTRSEDRLPVFRLDERAKCQQPVYEKVDTVVALGAAIRAGAVGGLHLTDQEGKIRVELRGLGLAEQATASVDGFVRAAESVALTGCKICLYVPESGFDQTVDLDDQGHFVFREVPYDVTSGSSFNFEILAADGSVLGIVARRMRRDKNNISCTRKPVLSRAIAMDVSSGSGVERMVLVPALAPLEAEETFQLSHPGGTSQVRFRLYQKSRLIKEVIVPVPSSLPRGTAINLTIRVDEFSFITIKGDIADQQFDARIEPPPPRSTPTMAEAAALETSFREGLAYLSPGEQMEAETRFKQTLKAFRAACERHDDHEALNTYEEMEDIAGAVIRPKTVLLPVKPVFDGQVDELSKLVDQAQHLLSENGKDTRSAEDWKGKVEDYRQLGEKAYKDANQRQLAEALQKLDALRSHIIAELRSQVHIGDSTPAERANYLLHNVAEKLNNLERNAQAANNGEVLGNIEKMRGKLPALSQQALNDPSGVLPQLNMLSKQADEMDGVLKKSSDGGNEWKNQLPGRAQAGNKN